MTYVFLGLDIILDQVIINEQPVPIINLFDTNGYYSTQITDGVNSITVLTIDSETEPSILVQLADPTKPPVIVIGTCTHPPHRPPVAP